MKDNHAELGQLFWQFEVVGVPLMPRLVTRGKVGRVEGEWWLKVWGERLLFCAASAPDKVFAVVTPCEGEADLVAFWRAAVECEDYGEIAFHSQSLAASGADEARTGFVTICASDETAWTREWCGGEWIGPRELKAASVEKWRADVDAENERGWSNPFMPKPRSPFALKDEHLRSIRARSFTETERQEQAIFWLRGSHDEWKRVLQACVTLFCDSDTIAGFGQSITSGMKKTLIIAHTPFYPPRTSSAGSGSEWFFPQDWQNLFALNFVFIGWTWTRRKNTVRNTRSGWKVRSSYFSAQIRYTSHPSQHEQLEARLFLRDWLRGKAPASRIAKLLE